MRLRPLNDPHNQSFIVCSRLHAVSGSEMLIILGKKTAAADVPAAAEGS
jgi:hypothetical protein